MPLLKGKSQKAFSHNVKAEMDAGKPMKQSLAIAYATKRKPKKMNKGGDCYADGGKVKPVPSPAPDEKENYADKLMKMLPHAHAFGGDVQADVNKTYNEDPSDVDSIENSEHFASGGEVPGEEGKAMRFHSDLGSHVETLVDKMLEMKFGNKEAEHFQNGGEIAPSLDDSYHSGDAIYRTMFGQSKKPISDNSRYTTKEEGELYDKARQKINEDDKYMQEHRAKHVEDTGETNYAHGGRIEEMVDRHMAKKMASGGQIVEDSRAHDSEAGQSDEPWENNSQWKDTDLFSEDQDMNEDMDHEDSMEPNKKKKLMSSILESVRKHNMGK